MKLSSKKINSKIEEEKNENNHEIIIIKSNNYHYNKAYSVIEAKLPNPYLDTELVRKKKYINYNFKSSFKSKYADYLKNKSENNEITNNHKIKKNKTYKFSDLNVNNKYIYFTDIKINKGLPKRNKTLKNKDIKYSDDIIKEKS
jgi:hypothetical protein